MTIASGTTVAETYTISGASDAASSATNLTNQINNNASSLVTASTNSATVTITAKIAGAGGNNIQLARNSNKFTWAANSMASGLLKFVNTAANPATVSSGLGVANSNSLVDGPLVDGTNHTAFT